MNYKKYKDLCKHNLILEVSRGINYKDEDNIILKRSTLLDVQMIMQIAYSDFFKYGRGTKLVVNYNYDIRQLIYRMENLYNVKFEQVERGFYKVYYKGATLLEIEDKNHFMLYALPSGVNFRGCKKAKNIMLYGFEKEHELYSVLGFVQSYINKDNDIRIKYFVEKNNTLINRISWRVI